MKIYMIKYLKCFLILIFVFLSQVSCSSLNSDTGSAGDQDIIAAPTEIAFEANVDTTTYRAITLTNNSADFYTINNLALAENGCNAFSIFNITDESNNIVYTAGQTIDVTVASGSSVDINIRFSPTPCDTTSYTTTLLIYYTQGETLLQSSVMLTANVVDLTPDDVVCSNEDIEYYDEFDNPTERTLPVLPDGKKYYVEVRKATAYIQLTTPFSENSTIVGTEIDLEYIDEEDRFQPVYIPATAHEDGTLTIDTIDSCVGFNMPSAITHQFLIGAGMSVTTAQEFTGAIDRTENVGQFEIPSIEWTFFSFINNSASLMQSPDGFFKTNAVFNLTSGETEYNPYLETLASTTDDNGIPYTDYLNIQNGKLVGQDIRHGMMTVVGIGSFVETADALMSDESRQAIFENEAYMFLQLECMVTQAKP